jgi:hypothetical protein
VIISSLDTDSPESPVRPTFYCSDRTRLESQDSARRQLLCEVGKTHLAGRSELIHRLTHFAELLFRKNGPCEGRHTRRPFLPARLLPFNMTPFND